MNPSWRLYAALAIPPAVMVATACTGGGGTAGEIDGYEPATSTVERGPNSTERATGTTERARVTNEGAPNSAEPAPGAQGEGTRSPARGVDCAGTYECRVAGQDQATRVTLVANASGGCSSNRNFTLEPNGTITGGGQVAGSWSGSQATGFTITIDRLTTTCRQASGSTSGTGSSSGSGSASRPDGG